MAGGGGAILEGSGEICAPVSVLGTRTRRGNRFEKEDYVPRPFAHE